MKRILFVDDEPALLRGLERALRPRRHEWECLFVGHPFEALDMLAEAQPDAIVSDMRMPGVDGAELLAAAVDQCPSAIRVILSGDAGPEAFTRMAAVAHQRLAKPCKAEHLTDHLSRALTCAAALEPSGLRPDMHRLCGLPVLPGISARLHHALSCPQPGQREAALLSVLQATPAVTAKLLQVASWRGTGTSDPVRNVRDALRQHSSEFIATLMASPALSPVAADSVSPFMQQVSSQCAAAATVARTIAESKGWPPASVACATMVTVMSHAGPFLFDALRRDQYAAARAAAARDGRPLADAERDHFGISSAEAAAALFEMWGIDDAVIYRPNGQAEQCAAILTTVADAASHLVRERTSGGLRPRPAGLDLLRGQHAAWAQAADEAVAEGQRAA